MARLGKALPQHQVSYSGDEISVPKPLCWAAFADGLPSRGLAATIAIEELLEGDLREAILDAQHVRLPEGAVARD